jgi:hypothetical protein
MFRVRFLREKNHVHNSQGLTPTGGIVHPLPQSSELDTLSNYMVKVAQKVLFLFLSPTYGVFFSFHQYMGFFFSFYHYMFNNHPIPQIN